MNDMNIALIAGVRSCGQGSASHWLAGSLVRSIVATPNFSSVSTARLRRRFDVLADINTNSRPIHS